MWTFVLLCFLGSAFSQINAERTTQMYYVKLKIENGAISNLTKILMPLNITSNLTVDEVWKTTTCQHAPDSLFSCACEQNYTWSEEVCESHSQCCGKNECNFPKQSNHTCISNSRVSVKGSIKLGANYSGCLNNKQSKEFQRCNETLLKKMKTEYSTIPGFESLTITNYRVGSVITDFEIIFAMKIDPQDLIQRSKKLSKELESTCLLNTTGVVQLEMPHEPVHYNSQHKLICSAKQNLNKYQVTWQLKRGGKDFTIMNGSEATVAEDQKTMETSIALKNISELWAGEYTCAYRQDSGSCVMFHKASDVMDVCLKPNIYISINPSFPYCKANSNDLNVEVTCEIGNSSENYNVTWGGSVQPIDLDKDGVFKARTVVSCGTIQPQLTCTFTNRCNQSTSASKIVNFIRENDKFCEKEDEWEKTKAGFEAELRCKDKTGIRQRKCTPDGEWKAERSGCVNNDLHDLLQQATIVDIGQGLMDENAAKVFSSLEGVTENTERINTFPNLNASVNVLQTLSQKIKNQQDAVVNDFLGSSSNLLEKSLEGSWEENKDDNNSLAETYLMSVEQIIQVSNITQDYEKKNVEVASKNCSKEKNCFNKVFNTTVNLKCLNPGSVVTAGFKELQGYLPNKYKSGFEPNSYVISTTTEMNITDSVEVKINFGLLKPRPRNVRMICVAWDNVTHDWSDQGCEWSVSESVCECNHLSSFCVLMGKTALEVQFLTEITYVGLSVSVISLTISLLIELIVWSAVVKTSTSYLRHTAHVNICMCLLVADCCFLASSKPENLSEVWCKTSVVLKHFCYLAMFFWMLWLSSMLLHQTVFPFHNASKKSYLRLSVLMGYVCPLLIVTITILANKGANGQYYSRDTCWLVYTAPFKGSIHTFVIPVGIIAFFNTFAMLVVIMKLLDHPKTTSLACEKEKKAIITVMRTVVLLTPIFGVTWIFGFAVMLLDLTYGGIADFVNYVFTLLNAFQGLFILLTIYLGDTMTREELLRRLKIKAPAPPNDSCTDSTVKK